jgi:deoxyribose-phosphate aldolase
MKFFDEYNMTDADLARRLKVVQNMAFPGMAEKQALTAILGMLDMTTLEGSDTDARIEALCRQSRFSIIQDGLPDAAAVCVYPTLVRKVRKELEGTGIKIASVAGAFPSGQSSLHVKLEEVRFAINEGADEIDTVISRGKLLEGRNAEVFDELSALREVCGDNTLKVILETGELGSVGMIRKAGEIAILAGADFLKTSTGKIATSATPEAFLVMCDTCREYLEKTGKSVGVKAAGGIRTSSQALGFAKILVATLGEGYFDKGLFRIGASSLATDVLKELGLLST